MDKEKIKNIIDKCLAENPCEILFRFNEPMSAHTTFRVGGPADCWIRPLEENKEKSDDQETEYIDHLTNNGGSEADNVTRFCVSILNNARSAGVPVFILGGGANIVVSDRGIRGITLDTAAWKGHTLKENKLIIKCGTTMDEAAECAAEAGLCGLEFLAGIPGTIGGAVWMNARCYGSEIADVLEWTEIICKNEKSNENDFSGTASNYIIKKTFIKNKNVFGYKRSPFQKMDCLITRACFNLSPGDKNVILGKMEKYRQDRKEKGHYLFPCAGSVFKNNHDFGKPAGVIIDELGMRGLKLGGAQVAPFHGNIIINTGNATAADIRALAEKVAANVREAAGFILEPEILFIGE
ncbi:MAG: UDP-N-acetylmuramate dehydrogenase [Treponema sp.]|nr:UDP-N-acetylmuramate dehydrogenase [Treponema sp.]